MHSAATNGKTKSASNISAVAPKPASTKPAAAAIRAALTLAVLSALLLTAAGPAHAQTETVLYNFCSQPNCTDGAGPDATLNFYNGNFYGTTSSGGQFGYGTVFELSPNGSGGWNEAVLYSFTGGADGANPASDVISNSEGNLYGTTTAGGTNGQGTVFELSPAGSFLTETVLYNFCSQPGCIDGADPSSGLIFDTVGNVYGTTLLGGPSGYGAVFELSPTGGSWTEQAIYSPASTDGYGINGGLALDAAGNIFGATSTTAFELSPNGNGGWNPTVIHTFTGAKKDGYGAEGTPVLDAAGNVYGTTVWGGLRNYGTVYKLSPGKKGWKEKILHSFRSWKTDGGNPEGIVIDSDGNVYGTTLVGGKYGLAPGYGTVFELVSPVGKQDFKEMILWTFDGTDGSRPPLGNLVRDSSGNLYGTASAGGLYASGVVFEITP